MGQAGQYRCSKHKLNHRSHTKAVKAAMTGFSPAIPTARMATALVVMKTGRAERQTHASVDSFQFQEQTLSNENADSPIRPKADRSP